MIENPWIGGANQDGELDRRRYALEYQRDGMTQAESAEAASRRIYAEARFRQAFQDAVITLTHAPEYMAAELHVRLDMIRNHIDTVKEITHDISVAGINNNGLGAVVDRYQGQAHLVN